MTDEIAERRYWNLALPLGLASPIVIYFLGRHVRSFVWPEAYLPLCLLLSIPVAFLVDFLLGAGGDGEKKFMIRNPSVKNQAVVNLSMDAWLQSVRLRLSSMGYTLTQVNDSTWKFAKAKRPPVHNFQDHSFLGTFIWRPSASGAAVESEMVMNDLIIMETGERQKLRALLLEILGDQEAQLTRSLPLTLRCAANDAILLYAAAVAKIFYPRLDNKLLFALSITSAGMAFLLFRHMLADRQKYVGIRLGFLTFYLGLLPFLAFCLHRIL